MSLDKHIWESVHFLTQWYRIIFVRLNIGGKKINCNLEISNLELFKTMTSNDCEVYRIAVVGFVIKCSCSFKER